MSSHNLKKGNNKYDEAVLEKIRKHIEVDRDNALSLYTKKVLLAHQAYDLIDNHIKRVDEDLNNFPEDLKQGTSDVMYAHMHSNLIMLYLK
ncbi:hypothetical protein Dimus_031983 [Dionaea muscipula]